MVRFHIDSEMVGCLSFFNISNSENWNNCIIDVYKSASKKTPILLKTPYVSGQTERHEL